MDIQIKSIHFKVDAKFEELIHKKITKLETYYSGILDAEVHLHLDGESSHIKEKEVHIKLHIPGASLNSSHKSHVFEESLDHAVESLRRQLKKRKEKIKN